jgi:predicted nucleic acid-binding protein
MALAAVLDTNVLIAALRSPFGASYQILVHVGRGAFELDLSVPLVLEYESVAKRDLPALGLTAADVDAVLDFLCRVGRHRRIYFHWRPALPDPQDDMVLELAVAAGCPFIVTHNVKHFAGADRFGVIPIRPRDFLRTLRHLSPRPSAAP